ncbi:hypothetical protein Q3G72_032024 [Acer saccharum]|nr:hypothetical protein Q3G72_032024 [Acer saccharum]
MEGIVARRVIPSDNSCLFNAVGYAMDHDKNKAPELRQHLGLPKFIHLGKQSGIHNYNVEVYRKLSFAFGAGLGAIELSILADYYGCEIAAYDIQTTRWDLYGQMSPFDGAMKESDQTMFPVRSDGTIGSVEGLALNLVKEQHR